MNNIRHFIITLAFGVAPVLFSGIAYAQLACYDCHGERQAADLRPMDAPDRNPSTGGFKGDHRTHLQDRVSPAEPGRCAICHPGSQSYNSGHRDGKIQIAASINASAVPATYKGMTSAFPQGSQTVFGTCSNVNCHFETTTPTWGSEPLPDQCNSCHEAPPSDGSHRRKHNLYFGNDLDSCATCHPDHRNDPSPYGHATSAGNRGLKIGFGDRGGTYGGPGSSAGYPEYLPSQNPKRDGTCTSLYCHSDGRGGPPNQVLTWSDKRSSQCYSCHKGRSTRSTDATPQTSDSTFANCTSIFGVWSSAKGYCTPGLTMDSDGHHRLVGAQWVRKYPCYYCHNATMDSTGAIKDPAKHLNVGVEVAFAPQWEITNRSKPAFNSGTKVCDNIYCHSDGTRDPDLVRPVAWTDGRMKCNSCHGHPKGECVTCHDGKKKFLLNNISSVLSLQTNWPAGQDWKESLPMFANQGAGTGRANSHPRHVETNFTCDHCHSDTVLNGTCTDCHQAGVPSKSMTEEAHINPAFHVNKDRDVKFRDGGSWDPVRKTCSNTACHTGTGDVDPVWGGSVNSGVTCLSCHSTTAGDVDSFGYVIDGARAKINKTDWETTGHGRYSSAANSGTYAKSGNPAANFPGNPCWYCHDNNVLHNYSTNPFRLRKHPQYQKRFEKECVYCHMQRTDAECIACHVDQPQSLSPQATTIGIVIRYKFNNLSTLVSYPAHTHVTNCTLANCHDSDSGTFPNSEAHKGHDSNAGTWTEQQKKDIENQYMMMGVCLQCHDDDTSNQCTSCHLPPPDNPNKYALGFNPGTGYIKPRKARASGSHFGYKHYRDFTKTGGWTMVDGKVQGVWKGGKFCWDCHDPHGDSNIYMIQREVATETDGTYGIPKKRALVTFTDIASGTNYAKKTGTIDGICNVCHSTDSKHFTSTGGDGHNLTRRCTTCHEHRFADSHANKQSCDTCHSNEKPIPKHTSFGLPRDCTKCHAGTIGRRMDVIGQMKSNSHHVQGIEVTNRHCYECHWESTPIGLIDVQYHTGYNYLNYTSVKNDVVDLVLYGNGERPTVYRNVSTAAGRATVTTFMATNMGTDQERSEVSKISNHCLSCHNDENNDTTPFGDCKTPRQYAWDLQSIKARYSQTGTTTWGKYPTMTNAAQKNIVKSFSAHGNGVANGGGFNETTGVDGVITDTRGGVGNRNVQCFDCHNSHGSKVVGVTTSYVTFNGTNNGGNLKETKKDMGGYSYDYKASANASGVNPYGAGAGQCFDCHNTPSAGDVVPTGRTPWGYHSTFGASAPIMGYKDTPRFGQGVKASTARFPERMAKQTILGGHLKASEPAGSLPNLAKDAGIVSSASATTLTDSSKNWVVSSSELTNNVLKCISWSTSTELRKPATGYWSPVSGSINRLNIWFVPRTSYSTEYFRIYDQSGNLLWSRTGNLGSFSGWVDLAAPVTGIYATYRCTTSYYTGRGGDVTEVGTLVPNNKWGNLYVQMTGGSNSGQIRKITNSNATTLTFEPFLNPIAAGDSYRIVPYSMPVNGLCTPCHDPHGVSPALGANQAYAVPLLKGTWMSSPYKEDAPPPTPYGTEATAKSWSQYTFGYKYGLYKVAGNVQPITKHTLDRNTFGTLDGTAAGTSKKITENDSKFAGLCLNCHKKEALTDGTNRNNGASGFKTIDRIHESVRGWGVNNEHSFTCSKCHQPHNSGLPRLMQTNCLDYRHRGGLQSGGSAWSVDKQRYGQTRASYTKSVGQERRGYPIGSILGIRNATTIAPQEAATACHVSRFNPTYNQNPALMPNWPDGNLWNGVTPW